MACSLADRHLVNLAIQGCKAPCLIHLAIVCTLISAKLEQAISPSFGRMVRLVNEEWGMIVQKENLIALESKVMHSLDFELY